MVLAAATSSATGSFAIAVAVAHGADGSPSSSLSVVSGAPRAGPKATSRPAPTEQGDRLAPAEVEAAGRRISFSRLNRPRLVPSRWLLRTATRALHRALSPTFPAGRWCSLSLGEGAPKTRARRISTGSG